MKNLMRDFFCSLATGQMNRNESCGCATMKTEHTKKKLDKIHNWYGGRICESQHERMEGCLRWFSKLIDELHIWFGTWNQIRMEKLRKSPMATKSTCFTICALPKGRFEVDSVILLQIESNWLGKLGSFPCSLLSVKPNGHKNFALFCTRFIYVNVKWKVSGKYNPNFFKILYKIFPKNYQKFQTTKKHFPFPLRVVFSIGQGLFSLWAD